MRGVRRRTHGGGGGGIRQTRSRISSHHRRKPARVCSRRRNPADLPGAEGRTPDRLILVHMGGQGSGQRSPDDRRAFAWIICQQRRSASSPDAASPPYPPGRGSSEIGSDSSIFPPSPPASGRSAASTAPVSGTPPWRSWCQKQFASVSLTLA